MPSPLDLAYAAGLIDGEGCIGIREGIQHTSRQRVPVVRCHVMVSMTDRSAIEWLSCTFGGKCRPFKSPSPQWKDGYKWEIGGRSAYEFCLLLVPFVKTKRTQVELVIRFYEEGRFVQGSAVSDSELSRRRALKTEMHRLNRRGSDYAIQQQ